MAQKYYTVQETAEALGVSEDEIKKMLEGRELYGYRDGSEWKFKAEDIDRIAKERQQAAVPEDADSADVLLGEVEVGQSEIAVSGTVLGLDAGARNPSESGLRLMDSGINLAEELKTAAPVKKEAAAESSGRLLDSGIDLAAEPGAGSKKGVDSKSGQFEDLDLTLDEDVALADSSVGMEGAAVGSGKGSSKIDVAAAKPADADLVLGGSDVGSDVTIGGDSGISLIDPSDSGISLESSPDLAGEDNESLALGEEDTLTTGGSVKTGVRKRLKTDDDFLLTPLEDVTDTEESESGSQVIALDTEGDETATMVGGGAGMSRVSLLDEAAVARPAVDLAASSPLTIAPAAGTMPRGLTEGIPLIQPAAVLPEVPYTGWQLASLAACMLFVVLCLVMVYDVVRNQEAWNGAFSINGSLMDGILSLFEKR